MSLPAPQGEAKWNNHYHWEKTAQTVEEAQVIIREFAQLIAPAIATPIYPQPRS